MNDLTTHQKMVLFLIAKGCAIDSKTNRYGAGRYGAGPHDFNPGDYYNDIIADAEATKKALKDLKKDGIDWEKTSTVKDGTAKMFDGSFVDPIEVKHLKMQLVTKSGEKYDWVLKVDTFDFIKLFEAIDSVKTLKSALGTLEKRVKNARYPVQLGYN